MSEGAAASGRMPPRDILVVSDLTLAASNAAWRAAHLARAYGAALRILHAVREPGQEEAARAWLLHLAESVQHRLGVAMEVEVTHGELARVAARAAPAADLLVVPARGANTLRERICGTATERLLRASRIPVLVVKRPLARSRDSSVPVRPRDDLYERVLVGVQLAPEASGVIAAAGCLSMDPRMEVFHAMRPDKQAAPELARDAPGTAVERARATVRERIGRAGAHAAGAVAAIGVGEAGDALVAKARGLGAELIVLGRRESRLLGDLFIGAVTAGVLSASRCDVLLVPTDSRSLLAAPAAATVPEASALG